MNHVDTFSGIGAWSLAAKWMGWNTLVFCEKEPFCQQILNKNFPDIPIHDDIFTFSGKPFRDRVGILTGSTPCQPFSQAGKREGSNDERHLFPEFLRVVGEMRPEWVVIENVYGLLNIESGRVFEAYNTSLESEGYSVQTLCVPASALNAPHRRDRLWIVAHAIESGTGGKNGTAGNGDRRTRKNRSEGLRQGNGAFSSSRSDATTANARHTESNAGDSFRQVSQGANSVARGSDALVANADNTGIGTSTSDPDANRRPVGVEPSQQSWAEFSRHGGYVTDPRCEYGQSGRDDRMATNPSEWAYSESDAERCNQRSENATDPPASSEGLERGIRAVDERRGDGCANSNLTDWHLDWRDVAVATCIRGVDDGFSVDLDGFKLTKSKHREARLKALGNAILPQIAYEIFKAIDATRDAVKK